MKLLVPAAGNGTRFRVHGVMTPKPLIRFSFHGRGPKEMVRWAVDEAAGMDIEFLIKQEDATLWAQRRLQPRVIGESTRGQAHTIYCALEMGIVDDNEPFMVVNSDVHLLYPFQKFVNLAHDIDCSAALVVTKADQAKEGKQFSFVDQLGHFNHAVEKEEWMSPWAITGHYWFKSPEVFMGAYKRQIGVFPEKEPQISETFNQIRGEKYAHFVPRHRFTDFGTYEKLTTNPNVTNIEMENN